MRDVIVIAVASGIGAVALAAALAVRAPTTQKASLVLAYESLGALLVTLAIGPLNVLRRRPNPVSMDVRRDVGLWAAATGVGHVVFSLQHHFGGDVVRYFFKSRVALSSVRHDLFGVGVWSGVAATIVLVGLASISNDAALRKLGPAWKMLQRTNYLLALVVLIHTVVFWHLLSRGPRVRIVTAVAAATVLVLQTAGVRLRRRSALGQGVK